MKKYQVKLKDIFSGCVTTKIAKLPLDQVEKIKKAIKNKSSQNRFDSKQQIMYNWLPISINEIK